MKFIWAVVRHCSIDSFAITTRANNVLLALKLSGQGLSTCHTWWSWRSQVGSSLKACPTSLAVLASRMGRMWRSCSDVVLTGLANHYMFVESKRWYQWYTPSSLILSDMGMGEPLTSHLGDVIKWFTAKMGAKEDGLSTFRDLKQDHCGRTRKWNAQVQFRGTYPVLSIADSFRVRAGIRAKLKFS